MDSDSDDLDALTSRTAPVKKPTGVPAASVGQVDRSRGSMKRNWRGDESTSESDPHNLGRFVAKHVVYFSQAMEELRAGRKSSCWSWYLLPTPPFIKNGHEVGSETNRVYALRTTEEAREYLVFKHPTVSLRTNYLEMMRVVALQLTKGVSVSRLMGIDVPRLKASVAYFERVARQDDPEVHAACAEVMDRLEMPRPAVALTGEADEVAAEQEPARHTAAGDQELHAARPE